MTLAIVVFLATYLLLIDGYYRRTVVVCVAVVFLLLTGVLTPIQALRTIDWNVMGIFFGMLVIADLFLASRMPAVLAAKLAARTKTVGMAVLGMCVLASALSAFLENVAVVLILAPIALALAQQLKAHAAPFLIGIALSSNLQGTATLVGDPPSMILGTFAGLTFNDFFWYHGRPGIFFAVQVGAVFSFAMLWLLFRKFRATIGAIPEERPRSYAPSVLLVGVIVTLAVISFTVHDAPYASGITVLLYALIGWLWHLMTEQPHNLHSKISNLSSQGGSASGGKSQISNAHDGVGTLTHAAQRFHTFRERLRPGHALLRQLDWETTLFLVGIFVIVGSLSATGAIAAFTEWFQSIVGGSVGRAYVYIVVASVALSAFIDNVPFVLAR
ncbi:hypothetical protein HY480_04490, partial [Candidatus Uhrbacteria bacterium]|nr:hypothetical protein [Candidatus Uhrbacteria bacterium]